MNAEKARRQRFVIIVREVLVARGGAILAEGHQSARY
jgi:hypothetical protein